MVGPFAYALRKMAFEAEYGVSPVTLDLGPSGEYVSDKKTFFMRDEYGNTVKVTVERANFAP